MEIEKVRSVLNRLIETYRENPARWPNERECHWSFFQLLFDEFPPEEIKRKFRWEVPVGTPDYGTGNKSAAVDLVWVLDGGGWVGIEIEGPWLSPGEELGKELVTCVRKLGSAPSCEDMKKGYVVPLISCHPNKRARGYGMTYRELIQKNISEAREFIHQANIEVLEEGVIWK